MEEGEELKVEGKSIDNSIDNLIESEVSESSQKKEKKNRLDFSKLKYMAFKFMYIGKNYEGLVLQNHTKNTVEEHILAAFKRANLIENYEKCNYARCGRTDAGVSSTGNVFSLNVRYKEGLDYVKIINNLLPNDIMVIGSSEVDESFDARFSCLYREYKYFFIKGYMDIDKIKLACAKLEGTHNFKNFCKIDKSDPNYLNKNYERRIYEFSIRENEDQTCAGIFNNHPYFKVYYATIRGSAFLWHQVRCMMGILFLIGRGLEDLDIIDYMLDTSLNKTYNYEIASEIPLVLSDCQFEGVTFSNNIENYAESFFSLTGIYEQNLIQIASNSFFLKNLTNLVKPEIKHNMGVQEGDIINHLENKYRRKRKYTKLLNHKTNRENKKKK